MKFQRFTPAKILEPFIECFWVAESEDVIPVVQKIIPDGFPEVIFHCRDAYSIKLHNKWEIQAKTLVAGQITKHFFLQNAGASAVAGIKFKPAALTHLFGFSMDTLTDRVLSFSELPGSGLHEWSKVTVGCTLHEQILSASENYLAARVSTMAAHTTIIDEAIDLIFESRGAIPIAEICKNLFITERQLQRLFKKYIGLSPKFYTRIIRFNNIFSLLQEGKTSWLDITYHSGYFDQSHFIRDFKEFTGEDPSKYFFDEPTMANFFLKKK